MNKTKLKKYKEEWHIKSNEENLTEKMRLHHIIEKKTMNFRFLVNGIVIAFFSKICFEFFKQQHDNLEYFIYILLIIVLILIVICFSESIENDKQKEEILACILSNRKNRKKYKNIKAK